jgi:hypothetical protein
MPLVYISFSTFTKEVYVHEIKDVWRINSIKVIRTSVGCREVAKFSYEKIIMVDVGVGSQLLDLIS